MTRQSGLSIISGYAQKYSDQKEKFNIWPDEYTHKKTNAVYKPHNEDEKIFVYDNKDYRHLLLKAGEGAGKSVAGIIKTLNFLRAGCDGAMGCVAPETMVNGIPIAERTKPDDVHTLLGNCQSYPSYRKGKADLFRVVTQSGHEVVVTKFHRFLTPLGWRTLSQLDVGDAIALCDNERGLYLNEKQQDCVGDYPSNPHLYDVHAQNDLIDHSCIENYFYQKYPVSASVGNDTFGDIFSSVYNLNYAFDKHDLFDLMDWNNHQISPEFPFQFDSQKLNERDIFFATLTDFVLEHGLILNQRNNQYHQQSPVANTLYQTISPYLLSCIFSSYPSLIEMWNNINYTSFSSIQQIKFERYGEFYDMTVPGVGHYEGNGILHHNSPDFPHFKRSLWKEFVNWCPPQTVVKKHRYRLDEEWEPGGSFELIFINQYGGRSRLTCGGFKEDLMGSWEGPNLTFVFFDEARRHKTAAALKTFDGRIRIPGPNGERPQFFISSTPRMHWLFDYFGPLQENDKFEQFKKTAFTGTISTYLNKDNLDKDYVSDRENSLTENETKILVHGQWAEEENSEKFVNIGWWDACKGQISETHYPCVISLDASKGSTSSLPDTFSLIMTSRAKDNSNIVEVKYLETWQPQIGEQFYYKPVENTLRRLLKQFPVVEVAYDPYQLHHFCMTLKQEGLAYFREFTQQSQRFASDKQLLDLILEQRIRHDGNKILRSHIDNANIKKYDDNTGNKVRLVKRNRSLKIDAAVCLSMAVSRTLFYAAV